MKKLLFVLMGLLIATNAHAGLISIQTLSSDNDFTYDRWNESFNTVKNVINGSIETTNIAADTLTESDFADDINPRVRWGESFNDFTVSGQLAPTATGLSTTTTAGISYVEGYRVETDATAHTYTASKDTWTYIDINGTFQYVETSVGSAAPTTPANSLLLFKVTTDGSDVTVVTDLRTTSISLAAYEDYILKGMELVNASPDTTQIIVQPGVVYVGSTRVSKTADITLDMDTASDWYDGSAEAYAAYGQCYVGVDDSGNVKLLGTNAPDYTDTSGNQNGRLYYYYDSTDYWRVIGQVTVNSADAIIMWQQQGDMFYYIQSENVTQTVSTAAWEDIDCSKVIPATATEGLFNLYMQGNAGDSTNSMTIRPNGTLGNVALVDSLSTSGQANGEIVTGQRTCFVDSSGKILHREDDTAPQAIAINVQGYRSYLRD